LFHAGATAILVNPSTRAANVTITNFGTASGQSLTIPARGRAVTTLRGVVQVQSSEPLAAIERSSAPGKLSINTAEPVARAQATLVFPHAVIGGGYTSTLMLPNLTGLEQDLTITFGTAVTSMRLVPNAAARVSLAALLEDSTNAIRAGAVTITAY